MQDLFVNYSDMISIICIPLIISILAFVFPLLIQAIERIDSKYSSSHLVKMFWRDPRCLFFKLILIISLFVVVFYAFAHFCRMSRDWAQHVEFVLFVVTVALIISTLRVIRLTVLYYMPEPLIERALKFYNQYQKRHKIISRILDLFKKITEPIKKRKAKGNDELDNFQLKSELTLPEEQKEYAEGLVDIIRYQINNTNDSPNKLINLYVNLFGAYLKSSTNEFPIIFYNIITDLHRTLCQQMDKDLSRSCSHAMILSDILLFSTEDVKVVHEKTYRAMWEMLVQTVTYNRLDILKQYWKKAEQYLSFNKDIANPRRYIEFHDVVCTLLLYKGEWKTLNYLLYYTHMIPPVYHIMPERLDDVIIRFMQISKNTWEQSYFYYQNTYPLPEFDDIDAETKIEECLKRYYAVLFLRQYTLPEYFVTQNRLDTPDVSKLTQQEKATWVKQLDALDYYVDGILQNTQLLYDLGWEDKLRDEMYILYRQTAPDKLLNEFKNQLIQSIEETKKQQKIDESKRKEYDIQSNQILSAVFKEFEPFFGGRTLSGKYHKLCHRGLYNFLPKDAFVIYSSGNIYGVIELMAKSVANELVRDLLNILMFIATKKYILREKNIFPAIDILELSPNEYSIVSIGNNLSYYVGFVKDLHKKDGKWYYKGFQIIHIPYNSNKLLCQAFYIMRTEELPTIIYHELSNKRITDYELDKVNSKYNIYTTLINLYTTHNEELLREARKALGDEKLYEYVAAAVDVNIETRIAYDVKMIRLDVWDVTNKTTLNECTDVENIWEEKA